MKISDKQVEFTTKLFSNSRWPGERDAAHRQVINVQMIDKYQRQPL